MKDQIKLLQEEIDEIVDINSRLSTYITVGYILCDTKIEGIDIKDIIEKKQLYYKELSKWWRRIDKKYHLVYSDKYKYDIDVTNQVLEKKEK